MAYLIYHYQTKFEVFLPDFTLNWSVLSSLRKNPVSLVLKLDFSSI